jgi:exodeoxyribonuclease VII large subunit
MKQILTVSELSLLIRDRLEQIFSDIWFEGEVSNLRAPSSGHLYFSLKDSRSQIRAVLFKAQAQRLRFTVKEGLCVIVRAHVTVYEPRGEYQAVLDYVEPKGLGALQLALEQLKEKLEREGLFDRARKRPLPVLPRRVGVVTSLSGAAIRDILTVLRRRCPLLSILIVPVPVQGDGAAPRIAEAIRWLSDSGEVDVMIVGRGGGSLEDLWCFNDEAVVRAIAAARVPVVSAVGHEIDYTLADFAADVRAPTPSAAAEAVAPVLKELVRTLTSHSGRQEAAMRRCIEQARHRVVAVRRALFDPTWQLQRHAQYLDELSHRLSGALIESLRDLTHGVTGLRHRLSLANPLGRLRGTAVLVPQLLKRMEQGICRILALRRQAVRSLAAALNSLSPLAVLARGYSILQTVPGGAVVTQTADVKAGDEVRAQLADGQLLCGVREVRPDS